MRGAVVTGPAAHETLEKPTIPAGRGARRCRWKMERPIMAAVPAHPLGLANPDGVSQMACQSAPPVYRSGLRALAIPVDWAGKHCGKARRSRLATLGHRGPRQIPWNFLASILARHGEGALPLSGHHARCSFWLLFQPTHFG